MNNIVAIKELNNSVYEFLNKFDPSQYSDGRYELEDGVYVNIESYTTQFRSERKFESHQKYIDIQYMIDGEELITVCPKNELTISEPYIEEKDIVFYGNDLKGEDFLISSGCFLILNPADAHMPCVCVNGRQNVRKAVFKIPIK